eukprot:TRINITY_DN2296_c0_g2_i1.p2 TRINITY_DN2296_c0_g2~~TRINITY_DN2296_c0_g2_i1.p2  ORF type:complete len:124 (-),score=55.39 TRINITY_DN2296_c0_g2_i1:353-724(-)
MTSMVSQLYRKATIGIALHDSLVELVENGVISDTLAETVLEEYDRSINTALADMVHSKISFKAHCHTYNFCNNVWTFILEDVTFKSDNADDVVVDLVRIVASDGKEEPVEEDSGDSPTPSSTD